MTRVVRARDTRHAGLLVAATVAAQVLLLATLPVLTRLFPPEAWGQLGALTAIATVAAAIGALSYDSAIVIPRSERAARALFALSVRLSALTLLPLGALVALLGLAAPQALGGSATWAFLGATLATVWGTTLTNTFGHALGRMQRYRPIAVSKLTQTAFPSAAQIGFGLAALTSSGLLLGRGLGMVASAALLARALPPGYRVRDALSAPTRDLLAAARLYKDFLLHIPRQILVRGSTGLPALLIVAFYGAATGGLFFFAQRLVERPGALLGDALSRVPMRRFARLRAERRPLLRQALTYTALVGAPVIAGAVGLALVAEPALELLFGEEWRPAAAYVTATAVWAAARMVSLPLAVLTTVLRKQSSSLIIDLIFSLRVLVIPLLAASGATALVAIWAFVGLSLLYHLATTTLGVLTAFEHDTTLTRNKRLMRG